MNTIVFTYRYRVKDKHAAELARQARAVNFVWNWCNETQRHAVKWGRKWLLAFDLHKLSTGASKELDIHAQTVQKVCERYAESRQQHKRPWLRWRGKKSLGWVPFSSQAISFRDGAFYFRRKRYDIWLSRQLPEGFKLRGGSFTQDARGRWYINMSVDVPVEHSAGKDTIGIDLGVKTTATCSDGEKIDPLRIYQQYEGKLAIAQRARKKKRAAAIHAKIANIRKDYLHKRSTALVSRAAAIFIGSVPPKFLASGTTAKNAHDGAAGMFKAMLAYKAIAQQVWFEEVDEKWTSQLCSVCGEIPENSPKGEAGLGIRGWTCSCCGAEHDRDVNAARNILARGLARLEAGISTLYAGEEVKTISLNSRAGQQSNATWNRSALS